MTRSAEVSFDWADGNHTFALKWGQLIELQEKCDAGPYVVLQRLGDNEWRMEDVSETIRLGLIGGGMTPVAAKALVDRYVKERPPVESITPAQVILAAALIGAPEEVLEKPSAEAE